MSRQTVRELKRAVQAAARPDAANGSIVLARDSALSLLARSIGFGHGRLAVIRLGMAIHAGAEVPDEHWAYCRSAAHASRDLALLAVLDAAEQQARRPSSADSSRQH